MSDELTNGRMCFLSDGSEAVYVAPLGDGHLVRLWVEDYDRNGDSTGYPTDQVIQADHVYLTPPRHRKHEEIAAKEADLANLRADEKDLRDRLSALRRTLLEETAASRETMERLKATKGLERLDDFIAGRITHVVMKSYSEIAIHTFADAFDVTNDYGRKEGLKLLSLFGRSNGDLQWRLSPYSDGSGTYTDVYPFCSLEEAQACVRALCAERWSAYRADPQQPWTLAPWIKAATQAGLTVPPDILDALQAHRTAAAKTNVNKAEAALAKARSDLAVLEGATP